MQPYQTMKNRFDRTTNPTCLTELPKVSETKLKNLNLSIYLVLSEMYLNLNSNELLREPMLHIIRHLL